MLFLGLLENDDWHWRDNLIADVVALKKKKTVWIVSLGILSAAKFWPSLDTSGALPLCHW